MRNVGRGETSIAASQEVGGAFHGEKDCFGYTAITPGGAIEATSTGLFLSQREHGLRINAESLGDEILQATVQYLQGLRHFGSVWPWIAMVTLAGCEGARLLGSPQAWPSSRRARLELNRVARVKI